MEMISTLSQASSSDIGLRRFAVSERLARDTRPRLQMQRVSLEQIADQHYKHNGGKSMRKLGIGTTSPSKEHRMAPEDRPGGPDRMPWNSAPFHGRPLPKKGGWIPQSVEESDEPLPDSEDLKRRMDCEDAATDLPGIWWNFPLGDVEYGGPLNRPSNRRFMEDSLRDACRPQKPQPGMPLWDSRPYHAVSVAIGGRAIWEPVETNRRGRWRSRLEA